LLSEILWTLGFLLVSYVVAVSGEHGNEVRGDVVNLEIKITGRAPGNIYVDDERHRFNMITEYLDMEYYEAWFPSKILISEGNYTWNISVRTKMGTDSGSWSKPLNITLGGGFYYFKSMLMEDPPLTWTPNGCLNFRSSLFFSLSVDSNLSWDGANVTFGCPNNGSVPDMLSGTSTYLKVPLSKLNIEGSGPNTVVVEIEDSCREIIQSDLLSTDNTSGGPTASSATTANCTERPTGVSATVRGEATILSSSATRSKIKFLLFILVLHFI
jgi:hypothetical protein